MNGRTTTLEQQAERVARRIASLGRRAPMIEPNSGDYRTAAKRALLTAIEDEAAAQGRSVPFKANFRRT